MTIEIAVTNLGGPKALIEVSDGSGSWYQPDLTPGTTQRLYIWKGKSITIREADDDDTGTDNQPR